MVADGIDSLYEKKKLRSESDIEKRSDPDSDPVWDLKSLSKVTFLSTFIDQNYD